jgi:P27 family predicted phage terminase small subunit
MALSVTSKNLTKAEIAERQEQETLLKGASDDIRPSHYLTETQVEMFNNLVSELEASGILCNVDSENLSQYVFALDQLQTLNDMINRNPQNMFDKQMLAARSQLVKECAKHSTDFNLTPQARAKMGSNKIKAKEKAQDPLLAALKVVK